MADKRYNRKSFAPIGEVLERVVQQHRPSLNQALIRVWDLWEGAVGDAVAANTRPAAFKGDLLLVHVSNSTWLHHLRYLERDLVDKLNEALEGEYIRQIKLKIGPV